MTDQNKGPLSLDLQSVAVFATSQAQPVAILNEASSLHSRLIYCDCLVKNLSMIADVCTNHDQREVQYLAGVFANQLEPLSKLLNCIALEVATMERAAV